MDSKLAPESSKTAKAREKLQQQMESVERKITEQAIKKKMQEMKVWISKYAMEREVIRDESNAPITKTTAKIATKIQEMLVKRPQENE